MAAAVLLSEDLFRLQIEFLRLFLLLEFLFGDLVLKTFFLSLLVEYCLLSVACYASPRLAPTSNDLRLISSITSSLLLTFCLDVGVYVYCFITFTTSLLSLVGVTT